MNALTERELEVLMLMAEGLQNKTIADRLGISFHTAHFHVANVARKMGKTSRAGAVGAAAMLGLIGPRSQVR